MYRTHNLFWYANGFKLHTTIADVKFTRGYTSVLEEYKAPLSMTFHRFNNTVQENVNYTLCSVTVPADVNAWTADAMYSNIDIHRVLVSKGQAVLVHFGDIPRNAELDVNIKLLFVQLKC